jgi:hypothetical protein
MKLKPLGANQTTVTTNGGLTILFSYETPVACIENGQAYKTDKQWSRTTSKHINQWLKDFDWVNIKPQASFDNLLKGE